MAYVILLGELAAAYERCLTIGEWIAEMMHEKQFGACCVMCKAGLGRP